jgi:hypothetical protein
MGISELVISESVKPACGSPSQGFFAIGNPQSAIELAAPAGFAPAIA